MTDYRKVSTLAVAALVAWTIPTEAIALNIELNLGLLTGVGVIASEAAIAQAPSFPVPTAVPEGTQVRISAGSDRMETLSRALEQGFENAYAGSEVDVEAKTADQAIQDVLNDNADFAAISRPLTAAEKAKGLEAIALQRPKIAIVVDQSNPFAQSLTGNQFAQIFRGEINNWADVGGTDRPIKLIDRPATNEIRQSFQPYPVFTSVPFEAAADAITLQPDTTAALAAALGPDGIGYVLVSELDSQPGLKALQLHQTPPTDPRYPFSQPYSLVYARGAASPTITAFLGYAAGQPGQAIIAGTQSDDTSEDVSSRVAIDSNSTNDVASNDATLPDSEGSGSEGSGSEEIEGIGTLNADGQRVDANGSLINSAGFLVNADGDLVDSDGNLLADGNEGILGAGIDVGIDSEAVDDSGDLGDEAGGGLAGEQLGVDDQGEPGRWWWLLLPLAGLALLIWAAGKRSREEEIGYSASTEASTSDSDDRILSAFDSRVSDSFDSAASGSGAFDSNPIETAEARLAAGVSTATLGGQSAVDKSRVGGNSQRRHSEVQSAGEDADEEEWLRQAKQRINQATEQVKRTAAEIRDSSTEKT